MARVLRPFIVLRLWNAHNTDGAFPSAGLILSSNTLYGTADYGGSSGSGTVFKVNTNGTGFRTVHSFSSGVIITGPGGLVMSGNILYGTTYGGEASGSIFSVKTEGTGFTTLYSFTQFGIYTDSSGQISKPTATELARVLLFWSCLATRSMGPAVLAAVQALARCSAFRYRSLRRN